MVGVRTNGSRLVGRRSRGQRNGTAGTAGTNGGNYSPGGVPDPRLAEIYDRYDTAEKAMCAQKTIGERRKSARAMAPLASS